MGQVDKGGRRRSITDRMKAAHADYCEAIEQMIDDRLENPQGNQAEGEGNIA